MRTRRRLLQGLAALLSACGAKGDWIYPEDTASPDGGGGGTTGPAPPPSTPYEPGATGWTLVRFDSHPDLLNEGGFAYETIGGIRLIIAAGEQAGTWVAMDRICSHQSCDIIVNFGRFACPCHGSLWDDNGKLVGGPARNQDVYPTFEAPDGVWVYMAP